MLARFPQCLSRFLGLALEALGFPLRLLQSRLDATGIGFRSVCLGAESARGLARALSLLGIAFHRADVAGGAQGAATYGWACGGGTRCALSEANALQVERQAATQQIGSHGVVNDGGRERPRDPRAVCFGHSDAGTGVQSVSIFFNASHAGTIYKTPYTFQPPISTPAMNVTLRVEARDFAGNVTKQTFTVHLI